MTRWDFNSKCTFAGVSLVILAWVAALVLAYEMAQ